jgi:hypothetical protein
MGYICIFLNIFSGKVFCFMLYLLIDASFLLLFAKCLNVLLDKCSAAVH